MRRAIPVLLVLATTTVAMAVDLIEPVEIYQPPPSLTPEQANQRFWRIYKRVQEKRAAEHAKDPYTWSWHFECPDHGVLKSLRQGLTKPLEPNNPECRSYWLRTPIDINGNPTGPAERVESKDRQSLGSSSE
jgi:hypothetical protein